MKIHTVLRVGRHASAKLLKNQIDCRKILEVYSNSRGEVQIRKNEILERKNDAGKTTRSVPSMQVDQCFVDSDIEFPSRPYIPDLDDTDVDVWTTTTKKRSEFTKKAKADLRRRDAQGQEEGLYKKDPRQNEWYKRCSFCHEMEEFEDGRGDKLNRQKFKYCPDCKTCYCSKQCLAEDWSVHKTYCSMMAPLVD